jgi:hypothetical protein
MITVNEYEVKIGWDIIRDVTAESSKNPDLLLQSLPAYVSLKNREAGIRFFNQLRPRIYAI